MGYYLQTTSATGGAYIVMDDMSYLTNEGAATRVSFDIEFEARMDGTDFVVCGRQTSTTRLIFLKSDGSFELRLGNQTFNSTAVAMGIDTSDGFHKYELRHRELTDGLGGYDSTISFYVDNTWVVDWIVDGVDQWKEATAFRLFDYLFPLGGSTRYGAIKYYDYKDQLNAANDRRYDAINTSSGNVLPEISGNGTDGTQVGGWPVDDSEWVSAGPGVTSASNITGEGTVATFDLSGNVLDPAGATINGVSVGVPAFVSEVDGVKTYSYTAPLIADDATADLVISVDSTTASTVISYTNTYLYDFVHGVPAANSILAGNQFGSTQPVELKIVTDLDPTYATEDWSTHNFMADVDSQITAVADGETTITVGYFVTETGETGTFDRVFTIGDGVTVDPPVDPPTDNWPFPSDNPSIPVTWDWGSRHPMTQARTRMFKRNGS